MSEQAVAPEIGTELIEEKLSGAAIDGARIATSVAIKLILDDVSLPEEFRVLVAARLDEGLKWLHDARMLLAEAGPDPTSTHIVQPDRRIIVP